MAAALDAAREVALADGFSVGRELGGELAPGFGLGLDKGAPRRQRLRFGGVRASRLDEVEQVAGGARQPVPPQGLAGARAHDVVRADSARERFREEAAFEQGALRLQAAANALDDIERVAFAPRALERPSALPAAREGDVEGVFVFPVDIDARMPVAVALNAEREVASAKRLDPGRGGGVEVVPRLAGHALGLGFALQLGFALGFGLGLDKGARRRHGLGDGEVLTGAVDEVEQPVALLTGGGVLPRAPRRT